MVTSATPNAAPLTGTQSTLIKLLTGMFGSAPGTLLDDAESILNQHQGDWSLLVKTLADSELFHEHFYRRDLSEAEFTNDFLAHLVGPNDGTLVDPAAYNSIRDWLVNRLDGKEGERGQAMLEFLVALHAVPADDPTWGQAHRQFIERSELATELTQRLIASGENHDTLDALLISRQLLDWGKLRNLQTLNTLPESGQNALHAAMQQLIQLGEQNPAVYQAWMPKNGNLQDLQNALPGNGHLADLLTFLNSALQRSDSSSTVSNLIPTGGTDILAYFAQLRALNISLEKLLQTIANPGQELLALKALLQPPPEPTPAPTPAPTAAPDTTAPTASVTTASIQPSGNAVVQSSEAGTAYLVKDTITVSNLASITGAADNQFNSVTISTASTNTNLPAIGLIDGTYKVYTVDAAGNLSNASSNTITIDSAAPTRQSTTPADNALAVAVGANITLSFSEAMQAANGNLLIKKTSDDSVFATIAIGDTSQITISGSTVTINPTGNLAASTGYYVELASGVLTDLAGNAYAGISNKTTLNFTTLPANVLLLVTSTQGTANGLTFGFLDVNGSGTVNTNNTGDNNDDHVTWAEFETLDQAAPAWRMATRQELLDLSADPDVANPPTGWADDNFYWSSDSAGAGFYRIVDLVYGGTSQDHGDVGETYAAVVLVEPDTVAPTASVTTATIAASGNAVVQSSETGTAYLVKDSITVSNLASITSADNNQFNSVPISAANTATNLSAVGLIDGIYKVYAVDADGNLSAASNNTITIDAIAPTLQSTTPADNAQAVAVGANITLSFSEALQAANGNLLIKKTSDDSVVASIAIGDTSRITISGSTVTINPTSDLAAGTGYYVELAGGVLTDLAGNAYAGISDKTTLNFTTLPSTLFHVASSHGTASGLIFGFLDVNGSGTVDTVNGDIGSTTDDLVTWTEFNALDQAASAWRMPTKQELLDLYADSNITNPPADWAVDAYYWSSDPAGTGAAHWVVGLLNGNTYSYGAYGHYAAVVLVEPDTVAPTLQSTTPADNATAVAVGANITLSFSEAMQVASGNLLIKKTSDDSTVATIAIGDTSQITISGSTVTINPTGDLAAGTGYYVELASGVLTDLVGNAYAGINNKTVLNFTTLPANVLFPVTSTQSAANGLTFGFLDVNGNGTVDAVYGGSGSTTDDFVTWTEFDTLDQAAPAWRVATKQELLDLYADPNIANPPAGWAVNYHWSSDTAGPGAHWVVLLTGGLTDFRYDSGEVYAAVVLIG